MKRAEAEYVISVLTAVERELGHARDICDDPNLNGDLTKIILAVTVVRGRIKPLAADAAGEREHG